MKRSNYLLSFALMFLSLSMVFSTRIVLGQENESNKQVKIKITKKENGETETIDKTFKANDKEEIEKILKEYDIEYNLDDVNEDEDVEIIVKKRKQDAVDDEVVVDIDQLADEAVEKKAFLGVFFEQLSETTAKEKGLPDNKGVVITEIVEGSAAQKAGLQEGDFITKIDGKAVANETEFVEAIKSHDPNDEVDIVFYREGKQASVKATLGEREFVRRYQAKPYGDFGWHQHHPEFCKGMKEFDKCPFLGITLDNPEGENGIKIEEVIEGTTADKAGLKKGDVIQKINGNTVNNLPELREALGKTKIGEEVEITYQREGVMKTAKAPIQSKAECHAFKFDPEKMPHCFDHKMMHENMGMDKEQLKEHIEKKIEMLEKRLEMLENDQADNSKEEEVEITISLEDISADEAASLKTSAGLLEIEKLSFSPNPNNGRFNLDFFLPEKGKTTIRIVDINNKEIYNETLSRFSGQFNKQIDISENPKGVYFLQVTQNNKAFKKKIIIQ